VERGWEGWDVKVGEGREGGRGLNLNYIEGCGGILHGIKISTEICQNIKISNL